LRLLSSALTAKLSNQEMALGAHLFHIARCSFTRQFVMTTSQHDPVFRMFSLLAAGA
jgi:hypothetical protein